MINRYELKIELLSDMCVSDGGVYNSALDIDVCHDKYGFPYIPAKRLKGCLRESAIELKDWGIDICLEEIFGKKDSEEDNYNNRAALRLENAYLSDYEKLKEYAMANKNSRIMHPQYILDNYTYIRTQTSIDYDSGVADVGSLRTMRVVKKGLVFIAEISLDNKYEEDFIKCCTNLNHMGMSRTRGLGEVRLTLIVKDDKDVDIDVTDIEVSDNDNCFEYAITLKEPVICKSVNGGESNTLDYIEGSKILGLLAGKLKEQNVDFLEFMSAGELFCSNAYIDSQGKRSTEVPANIYSIKNENDVYIDKSVHGIPKDKQLNAMKHCYISYDESGNMLKKNVNTEEHYHHSRPEDKSIGRANDEKNNIKISDRPEDKKNNSKFYQMASICDGQTFRGYISGTNEQIKQIAKLLKQDEIVYIGYSRSAEYGKTVISECKCSKRNSYTLESCKEIMVKLEAPTIIYNENATYSTNPVDLINEVNAWLGIGKTINKDLCEDIQKYMKFITLGGYNVTWRMRKPTIEAFDKGTVLHYVFKAPVDIVVPEKFYIGERVTEGYGECSVSDICKRGDNETGRILEVKTSTKDATIDYDSSDELVKSICNKIYREYISKKIQKEAKKMLEKADKNTEKLAPTISNMLSMCKENDSFAKITDIVFERFDKGSELKQNKLEEANEILHSIKRIMTDDVIKEFEREYSVCNYSLVDMDYEKKLALEELLLALKYGIRKMKIDKGGDKYEE